MESAPVTVPAIEPIAAPANQHARKHGCYSTYMTFSSDQEKEDYFHMLDGFVATWRPANEVELCAMHTLAQCQLWNLRLDRVEHRLWDPDATELSVPSEYMREFHRKRRHFSSRYNRAMRELSMMRSQRLRDQRESERAAREQARVEREAARRREKAIREADRLERKASQEANSSRQESSQPVVLPASPVSATSGTAPSQTP